MKIWPPDQEAVLDFKVKTCTPSYCLVIELEQQKSEKLLKYVSLLSWWLQILSVTKKMGG